MKMLRYINKDALLAIMRRHYNEIVVFYGQYSAFAQGYNKAIMQIDKTETVEVQEVKHAHWEYCGRSQVMHKHMLQCSECLRTEFVTHKHDIKNYPYCHCGARMDDGVDKAKGEKNEYTNCNNN